MEKPIVLCILDGWGHGESSSSNALSLAHTPCWDALNQRFEKSLLKASGQEVGLPKGQMGNSEVGHMTIGAGRVVFQDLPRIDKAISDGTLSSNALLQNFVKSLKQANKPCHLMGLLSPGGVHSHQGHILALAKILAEAGVQTDLHAFLDGRDTPPQSAHGFIEDFLNQIKNFPLIRLVSLSGRYYAMDRDHRHERIDKAYNTLVKGEAPTFDDPLAYIKESYAAGTGDEFVIPAIATGYAGIKGGDGILIANFRADRVRQLLTRLVESPELKGSQILGMTRYSHELEKRISALFPPQNPDGTLGEITSKAGLTQLRLAETEKYAHVTYFLNGGREEPFPKEDRIMVPSPKVATYDLQPEMSAREVTDKLCKAIDSQHYDLIIVNYANADMVGHTGLLKAAIKAVEALDECLGRLWKSVEKKGGILAVTADHGNVEAMVDATSGKAHTAHTLNPVPFLLCTPEKRELKPWGSLADIAPTLLDLMTIEKPVQMSGQTLLIA